VIHFRMSARRARAEHWTVAFLRGAAALCSDTRLVGFMLLIHLAEQARTRRRLYIQWFNLCNYFLSAVLAAICYQRALALLPEGAIGQVAAAMAAGCILITVNRIFLAGALWLARGLSPAASGLL